MFGTFMLSHPFPFFNPAKPQTAAFPALYAVGQRAKRTPLSGVPAKTIHYCRATRPRMAAIKCPFIALPVKIQIFHAKNTPVHWGKFDPIEQECSLVWRKKLVGSGRWDITHKAPIHWFGYGKKTKKKSPFS